VLEFGGVNIFQVTWINVTDSVRFTRYIWHLRGDLIHTCDFLIFYSNRIILKWTPLGLVVTISPGNISVTSKPKGHFPQATMGNLASALKAPPPDITMPSVTRR
jgi:hypothetical protein